MRGYYQEGGASASLRLPFFSLPEELAGACTSQVRARLSPHQHSRRSLPIPPDQTIWYLHEVPPGNYSQSVCLHMDGCKLNSGDHLIIEVKRPGHDYGSATLAGLPKQLVGRLQSAQNAAARLIFKACRRDHIQPLLRRLHWLWMPECVLFRLAVLLYRCLHGSAPGYLASDLQRVITQRTSTTALFDYISTGHSTHCAFYHWRPHLSSDCCIGLE